MSTIRLVALDMAGTTIDDSGQVLDAFMMALQEHQIAAKEAEVNLWRGAAKRDVLRFFIERQFGCDDPGNSERVERAYTSFRTQLEQRYATQGVRVIPGVEATFTWLREHRIMIALTTGFDRRTADILLHAVRWHEGVIDASVCSDEVLQGRPAPFMIFRAMEATRVSNVRQVVIVGDTVLDLEAGVNAGVRGVVGVLSGSQTLEQLGRAQHTHLIASVADLPVLLESAFLVRS